MFSRWSSQWWKWSARSLASPESCMISAPSHPAPPSGSSHSNHTLIHSNHRLGHSNHRLGHRNHTLVHSNKKIILSKLTLLQSSLFYSNSTPAWQPKPSMWTASPSICHCCGYRSWCTQWRHNTGLQLQIFRNSCNMKHAIQTSLIVYIDTAVTTVDMAGRVVQ